MKTVKYSGNTPQYIDGFPKNCERSCKGAIHLLPNALRKITDDEYAYIKKEYSDLRIILVPEGKPSVKKATAQPKTTGKTEKDSVNVEDTDKKTSKKLKRRN